MRKLFMVFTVMCFGTTLVLAQSKIGMAFPATEGINLNEKDVNIPEDTKDKLTVVFLSYSQKARLDMDTWTRPVYENFIEEGTPASLVYDVNAYFVLMLTGVNQAGAKIAARKIKEGTDTYIHDNVLIYKGGLEEYRKKLDFKDRSVPYYFVLDKDGKILFEDQGRYTEKKMEMLGAELEKH